MNHARTLLLGPALAITALTLTACATSPWRANFEPEPGVTPLAPIPSDVVVVRPAPFERIDEALLAFERAWSESDTYWEDWPEHEKRAHADRLIDALQLPGGSDRWTILGASRFTSFNAIDPDAGDLRRFASDIGADHAIWSSYDLGRSERVIDRPVHYPSWHYSYGRFGHDGYGGYDGYGGGFGSHTVWVPVTIEADETLWMAYFLARR